MSFDLPIGWGSRHASKNPEDMKFQSDRRANAVNITNDDGSMRMIEVHAYALPHDCTSNMKHTHIVHTNTEKCHGSHNDVWTYGM